MLDALGPIIMITFGVLFAYAGFILIRTMNSLAESNSYTPYKKYYSVPMKPDEIYQALSIPAVFCEWKSEFRCDESILCFYHRSGVGGVMRYKVTITDIGHFSVFTISPFSDAMKGLHVNEDAFLAGKLNAIPISNEVMKPHS